MMNNRLSLRPVVPFLLGAVAAAILSVLVKSSQTSSRIVAEALSGRRRSEKFTHLGEVATAPRRVVTDEALIVSQTPTSCETKLLILVISDVRQKWKRDAQRQAWTGRAEEKYKDLGLSSSDFEYRYIVGRLFDEITASVIEEARTHKDIVVSAQNDYDSEAATGKTMWAVRWGLKHCSFSHLLKVEDHSFVNIPLVMKQWLPSMPSSNFYSGLVVEDARVPRDPEENWYMPEENFPGKRYPPYPQLHCIMSKDVARTLGDVMNPALEKVFYDDVGIANALMIKGINPRNEPKIIYMDNKCAVKSPYVVLKVLYEEQMLKFGKTVTSSGDYSVC